MPVIPLVAAAGAAPLVTAEAPDAQAAFSFVELIVEGADVPEIVAIIEYPDAGKVRIFFFCCHSNLYNLKNEAS